MATRKTKPHSWLAGLVPSTNDPRDLVSLSTGMSGLALSRQRIGLELVALSTPAGVRRQFQVRAETLPARIHLCAQLQQLYPQASIHPLPASEDPLHLGEQEAVSCVELGLGAPSYLPLRTWQRETREEDGTDPLTGVLAALGKLPASSRAVVQLVLTPAHPNWSRRAQRYAQEHPLEDERYHRQLQGRMQVQRSRIVEHELFLEGLGFLLLLVLLACWLGPLLPPWIGLDASSLLKGEAVHLSLGQGAELLTAGLVFLAGLCTLGWLWATIRRKFGQGLPGIRIHDPALVAQKTSQIAYRGRLRLYVIGPQPQGQTLTRSLLSRTQRIWQERRAHLLRVSNICWWIWVARQIGLRRRWKHGWRDLGQICRKAWRTSQKRWLLFRRRRRAKRSRADVLARLVAAFHAYHLASGNFFVPRSPLSVRQRLRTNPLGGWLWWRPAYFTPDEIASLFHLVAGEDLRTTSFVGRVRERSMPVPERFTRGVGQPLGVNVHQGQKRPVYFPASGFTCNLLALAGTGKGKSSLFTHLAAALWRQSTTGGCVLLDPHGDLAQQFLGLVPSARRDDVICVNLADRLSPVGLNLLDMSAGQDRDRVADTIGSTFRAFWRDNWGPRIDTTFQMSLLTLCEVNMSRCKQDRQHGPARQCTMLTLLPLLQHPKFRQALLREVWDPEIGDWWDTYFDRQPDRIEIAASVLTKISRLSASRLMRRIVGQPRSTITLSEIVTQGQILLVNTASGVVGADTATLFGSIFLGLLHASIAQQAERLQTERQRMYLFLDELQTFGVGVNLNAMLAELRKYGGNFALATQSLGYLDALDSTLRYTLLANTDQLFAFDMGAEDAKAMADEFGEDLVRREDILSLDNYSCYVKLTEAGARHPTFSLHLSPPPAPDLAVARALTEKSARVYGTPAAVVDKQLATRFKEVATLIHAADAVPEAEAEEDGLSPDFASIDRRAAARRKPWTSAAERKEVP
jgi:hypothetical protein